LKEGSDPRSKQRNALLHEIEIVAELPGSRFQRVMNFNALRERNRRRSRRLSPQNLENRRAVKNAVQHGSAGGHNIARAS
jgi:hypothetical protein